MSKVLCCMVGGKAGKGRQDKRAGEMVGERLRKGDKTECGQDEGQRQGKWSYQKDGDSECQRNREREGQRNMERVRQGE